VFLVDDEPAVRRGLELLLGREPGLLVCGSAATAAEALAAILTLEPDLVVVDLRLKNDHGCRLLRQLRRRCPRLKLLVFSLHDQPSFALAALRAGAHGYVTKEEGTEKLLEAIELLTAGKSYVTPSVAARMPPR
jgi:DNA-binding NarL/FixJ family response regulator